MNFPNAIVWDRQTRISTAASGDTPVLAAVAAQVHRVHGIRIAAAAAVVVQLRSGAAVLEVFPFAAAGFVDLPVRYAEYARTVANTALNLNLSAAVQVDAVIETVTSPV
jgi:hypothetical protein